MVGKAGELFPHVRGTQTKSLPIGVGDDRLRTEVLKMEVIGEEEGGGQVEAKELDPPPPTRTADFRGRHRAHMH